MIKICKGCGNEYGPTVFVNGKTQTRKAFEARMYCSITCRNKSMAPVLPPKTCEQCGEVFERIQYPDGSFERKSKYIAKRYCSKACVFAAKDKDDYKPPGATIELLAALNASVRQHGSPPRYYP